MDKKTIMKFSISILLIGWSSIHALTLGLGDLKIHSTELNEDTVSTDLQNAIIERKTYTVMDKKALATIVKNLEQCQSGLRKCDPNNNPDIKALDVMVFAEVQKTKGDYVMSMRAVQTRNWGVLYSGTMTSSDLRDLQRDLSAEMVDSLKAKAAAGSGVDKQDEGKYRLYINEIVANEEAQKLNILGIIDSMLITPLTRKGKFQVVENARSKELLAENEKNLKMAGLIQTNRPAMEALGATHYVNIKLNAYDEGRNLNYQVFNIRTRQIVLQDSIEWEEGQEKKLMQVMNTVAGNIENTLVNVLGQLEITSCQPEGVSIEFTASDTTVMAPQSIMCRADTRVDDIPAGTYTLTFKHEERDTLTQTVQIKSQEVTKLGVIKMPDIDMALYQEASIAEASGKYENAIEKYAAFYKKYPKHRMAIFAMYREGYVTQLRLKRVADGRKILESVLNKKPDAEIRSEAYVGMALGFKAEGNSAKANEIFKKITEHYSGTTAAEFAKDCLAGNCRD